MIYGSRKFITDNFIEQFQVIYFPHRISAILYDLHYGRRWTLAANAFLQRICIYINGGNKSDIFYETGNSFEGTFKTELEPPDSYVMRYRDRVR